MLETSCRGDWPVALTNLGEDRDICMLVCKARSMFNPPEVPTMVFDMHGAYGNLRGVKKVRLKLSFTLPFAGLSQPKGDNPAQGSGFPGMISDIPPGVCGNQKAN